MAKIYPDISHYHPVSDWTRVKANCPFVITKATQGTTYIDPTLTKFVSECENRGIPYWLYTYLNKGNELAQAKFLVQVCGQRVRSDSKYFVGYILDVEAGNTAAGVKEALTWLNKQGKKTMLYHMYSEYSKYAEVIRTRGNNCAWWEARYGANNGQYSAKYPCHTGAELYQFTSRGTCPGIPGLIDLNRIMGTTKPEAWFTNPKTASASAGASIKAAPAGSTLELAAAVMQGKYGSGDARKNALGSRYSEVQTFINHILGASTATLAQEVIAGKYGSGETRKAVLGSRYAEVQAQVNRSM